MGALRYSVLACLAVVGAWTHPRAVNAAETTPCREMMAEGKSYQTTDELTQGIPTGAAM